MAVKLQCPDNAALLRLFGQGGSREEMESLAQHGEQCSRCGERIDEMLRKDELSLGLAQPVNGAELLVDSGRCGNHGRVIGDIASVPGDRPAPRRLVAIQRDDRGSRSLEPFGSCAADTRGCTSDDDSAFRF